MKQPTQSRSVEQRININLYYVTKNKPSVYS